MKHRDERFHRAIRRSIPRRQAEWTERFRQELARRHLNLLLFGHEDGPQYDVRKLVGLRDYMTTPKQDAVMRYLQDHQRVQLQVPRPWAMLKGIVS